MASAGQVTWILSISYSFKIMGDSKLQSNKICNSAMNIPVGMTDHTFRH